MSEKNFGYLGYKFQVSLLKAIIEDKKYGDTIIDVLESKYFDNMSFKFIMENMKELYTTYKKIPDYNAIEQKLLYECGSRETAKIHLDTLETIKEDKGSIDYPKEIALNFCKQQNLKKELKLVNNIIDNGKFEEYKHIEEIIKNALQIGVDNQNIMNAFENIESALEKDSRQPIPLGIVGLDNLLNGGLGRGELGIVLAPTGTGKTTLLTKMCSTAFVNHFNVLHIFFEDNPNDIKRKIYTTLCGISPIVVAPDDSFTNLISPLPDRRDEVLEIVNQAKSSSRGEIKLVKLSSGATTIGDIRSMVRKEISNGFKIDLLIIDYIDCVQPDKSNGDEEWKGEGSVMRMLESMTSEFDIAIWTATQGNRDSISSEVVNSDQMGGSIKKAQIAHVIVSIAKTLEQKENKLGTLTLLKSRIGQDGIIFNNCKFDNEYLDIDTDTQNTLLGHKEQKDIERQLRTNNLYLQRKERLGLG